MPCVWTQDQKLINIRQARERETLLRVECDAVRIRKYINVPVYTTFVCVLNYDSSDLNTWLTVCESYTFSLLHSLTLSISLSVQCTHSNKEST